jgi:hypothetical protein
VLVGALASLHPHSALTFGLLGAGLWLVTRERRLLWTGLGALLGLPLALLLVGHGMAEAGGSIRPQPGWLAGSLPWPVFWLFSAGLPVCFGLAGIWFLRSPARKLLLAALVPFLAANLVVFQPWDWDNTKVLLWPITIYALAAGVLLARLAASGWSAHRRASWRGRAALAAVALALTLAVLPGSLALAYEQEQQSVLFTPADQAFALAVRLQTPPRAVVLAADVVNQPVACLAGRPIPLGYPGWIWSHGLPLEPREGDLRTMYLGGPEARRLLALYGVRYIAVGPAERATLAVNQAALASLPVLYDAAGYRLYQLLP